MQVEKTTLFCSIQEENTFFFFADRSGHLACTFPSLWVITESGIW